MKIVTIVGARPQFVKAATVSRVISEMNKTCQSPELSEVIVHTGQHYDDNMSKVFFDELDIPRPDYNLEIGGGTHGAMTGRMLEGIERVLLAEQPDWFLVYGDTNSTLAGALAAAKLHIPVAHVEAGLRSFNMKMPEEINRVLTDRVSTLLFCPTDTAVNNLKNEGVHNGVVNVGDVMYDASLFYRGLARQKSTMMNELSLEPRGYVLATCHRAENTDDSVRMKNIIRSLAVIAEQVRVIFPLHPRTRGVLTEQGLIEFLGKVEVLEPVSFLDMVRLEESARLILTDSGGVQKEAYFFGVPCITIREETEWIETVSAGCNVLAGSNVEKILAAYRGLNDFSGNDNFHAGCFGDGEAAKKIVSTLLGC